MKTEHFKESRDLVNCSFGSQAPRVPGELAPGLALANCPVTWSHFPEEKLRLEQSRKLPEVTTLCPSHSCQKGCLKVTGVLCGPAGMSAGEDRAQGRTASCCPTELNWGELIFKRQKFKC